MYMRSVSIEMQLHAEEFRRVVDRLARMSAYFCTAAETSRLFKEFVHEKNINQRRRPERWPAMKNSPQRAACPRRQRGWRRG